MGELGHLPIRIKEVEKIVTVEKEITALPAYVYRIVKASITEGSSFTDERSKDYYDSYEPFDFSRQIAIEDGIVVLVNPQQLRIDSSNFRSINRQITGGYVAHGLIAYNNDVMRIDSVGTQANSRSYYTGHYMRVTNATQGYTLVGSQKWSNGQVVGDLTYYLQNSYTS